MNDKVCKNCKHYKEELKFDRGKCFYFSKYFCCRYPKWLELSDFKAHNHYCGEFEWKGEYDD